MVHYLLIYLFIEKLIKIGIKAKTRKNVLLNFFDTTFWSVQVNVYANKVSLNLIVLPKHH